MAKLRLAKSAKAIAAFLAPTLTQVATAINSDPANIADVGRAAVLGTITAITVWAVPNE